MFKKLIEESTGKSPWLFHINAGSCNGCDIELVSVLTPRYDAERLGFKLTGTPRHADIVVVTGPVTKQSLPRVLSAISQVPEPRCIVTMGSCPQSGNVFKGSYSVAGPLSKYVHVDVDVAGCAPKPEAVIDGLALAAKILQLAIQLRADIVLAQFDVSFLCCHVLVLPHRFGDSIRFWGTFFLTHDHRKRAASLRMRLLSQNYYVICFNPTPLQATH